jgi:hypothetical protein
MIVGLGVECICFAKHSVFFFFFNLNYTQLLCTFYTLKNANLKKEKRKKEKEKELQ